MLHHNRVPGRVSLRSVSGACGKCLRSRTAHLAVLLHKLHQRRVGEVEEERGVVLIHLGPREGERVGRVLPETAQDSEQLSACEG